MKRVIIESPLAGHGRWWIQRVWNRWMNVRYARACMKDSLKRLEAPFASHLLYPQALDDSDFHGRTMGILAGQRWIEAADLIAIYTDRGTSHGMALGIRAAMRLGKPVEYRTLGGKWKR